MIINIQNLNEKDCEGCPFLQTGQMFCWHCSLGFNIEDAHNMKPVRPQECRDTNVKVYDTSKNRRETK